MEGSLDWARGRAEEILGKHEVPPLEKQQLNALDEIMKAVENEPVKSRHLPLVSMGIEP